MITDGSSIDLKPDGSTRDKFATINISLVNQQFALRQNAGD